MSTATETPIRARRRKAQEYIERYRSDPVRWVEEFLQVRTWSGMRLTIESVFKNKRTSVRAAHGLSKTFTAAATAISFLTLYAPAVVVTTAPTGRQVRSLLWKEIRTFYDRNPRLPGRCLTVTVRVRGDWFMFGFSSDRAPNLEGLHAPNILWVLDEAKGLPEWLYYSIEGSLTGPNGRVLEISTTDGADQQTPFRQHHTTRRHGWNCISLSAFDSPFVDPRDYPDEKTNEALYRKGKPRRGTEWPLSLAGEIAIATKDWIEDRRVDWEGPHPYMWETKVLGEFSEIGADAIIPLTWVLSAVDARLEFVEGGAQRFGLDVSRMGDDQTVMFGMQQAGQRGGWRFRPAKVWQKHTTMVTAGLARKYADGKLVQVDMIGVGAGVFDRLAEDGVPVVGVNSSEAAEDERTYYNRRVELWFAAREWFRRQYEEGGVLQIPDDPELIEDLTGLKYSVHSDGRLKAEPKEAYKKRLGRSPNKGDAFVYALFDFRVEQDEIQW